MEHGSASFPSDSKMANVSVPTHTPFCPLRSSLQPVSAHPTQTTRHSILIGKASVLSVRKTAFAIPMAAYSVRTELTG